MIGTFSICMILKNIWALWWLDFSYFSLPSFATQKERAGNAGIMLADAMEERKIDNPKVVTLGYPASYGGYPLSIEAFRNAIANSPIEIVRELPLARPDLRQSAYNAIVEMVDEGLKFHGVYAMDDDILIGAYEALNDRGMVYTKGENESEDAVTFVGTVCNGARELLETGKQYGTYKLPSSSLLWHSTRPWNTCRPAN